MKIGIVSNLYPPSERGGAELIASRIADELELRGHKVFVVSTQPFNGLHSLEPELNDRHLGRVYRFFPRNLYHLSNADHYPAFVRILWHFIDTLATHSSVVLKRILVNEEPDVMLTHNLKGIGLKTSRTIQQMGIRQIHTLHDVQLSIPSGLLLYGDEDTLVNRSFLRTGYERLVMQAIGKPNVVISPSNYLLRFYQDRGFFSETESIVLPNPAPNSYCIARVERPNGPTRFFFVGQLESHKGIEFLYETMKSLSFDFELHIAGDGSLRSLVESWCKDDKRIHTHGFISLGHILQLMSVCDAVVLPSLCYENSPTVIYEAMQVGLPVVASDIGGISELIEHRKNGMLFTPGNKDALEAALVEIEQKRVWFWDQTAAIRQGAQRYGIERYVNALEKHFQ